MELSIVRYDDYIEETLCRIYYYKIRQRKSPRQSRDHFREHHVLSRYRNFPSAIQSGGNLPFPFIAPADLSTPRLAPPSP